MSNSKESYIKIDLNSLKFCNNLNSIVDKKSPYNSIRNIQIKATKEGKVLLTSTNLEILIMKEVDAEYENFKEIQLKSHVLCDCLKKMSGNVDLYIEGNNVKLVDEKGKFVLVNCDEKYPDEDAENMEYICCIDEKSFLEAIKSTEINISSQEKGICKFIVYEV